MVLSVFPFFFSNCYQEFSVGFYCPLLRSSLFLHKISLDEVSHVFR